MIFLCVSSSINVEQMLSVRSFQDAICLPGYFSFCSLSLHCAVADTISGVASLLKHNGLKQLAPLPFLEKKGQIE